MKGLPIAIVGGTAMIIESLRSLHAHLLTHPGPHNHFTSNPIINEAPVAISQVVQVPLQIIINVAFGYGFLLGLITGATLVAIIVATWNTQQRHTRLSAAREPRIPTFASGAH